MPHSVHSTTGCDGLAVPSVSSLATDSDNASSDGSVTTFSDSSFSEGCGYPYYGGSRASVSAGFNVLKPTMLAVWLMTFERDKLQTYEVLYYKYQAGSIPEVANVNIP